MREAEIETAKGLIQEWAVTHFKNVRVRIFLFGSYITEKEHPSDIDILVDILDDWEELKKINYVRNQENSLEIEIEQSLKIGAHIVPPTTRNKKLARHARGEESTLVYEWLGT